MIKDPEILLQDAIDAVNGNQSDLAAILGVNRSAISNWKKEGRSYIPPLQAYRIASKFPKRFKAAA